MKLDIYEYIQSKTKGNEVLKERYANMYQERTFLPKATLLEAGKVAQSFYYIKQGGLRLVFNHQGKDVTLQFFFEGQGVASIESFMLNTPSLFSIETIEPTTVWTFAKADVLQLIEDEPTLKDELYPLMVSRLINYIHLFLSRIKDTPQQRYENLMKESPDVVKRVPLHYIASYLGITAVSLSRIRSRR